jgi:hypothetical protein
MATTEGVCPNCGKVHAYYERPSVHIRVWLCPSVPPGKILAGKAGADRFFVRSVPDAVSK